MKLATTITAAAFFLAGLAAGGEPKTACFEARHELAVKIPEGAKKVRIWLAMPQNDPAQKVKTFKVSAPWAHRVETDSEGNTSVYLEAESPKERELAIIETFELTRTETLTQTDAGKVRELTADERKEMARYLEANQHVVIDDKIRALSAEIVGGEKNTLINARKIYDWVLKNIDYWVKDPSTKKASPVGSSEYCLATKTGNCTDFHSL